MIERGTVVAVDTERNRCWVMTQRQGVCGACQIKAGCGRGWQQALHGDSDDQALQVDVNGALPALGDQVQLSVSDSGILKASFMLYLFPLLAMLAASLSASFLSFSEPWIITCALMAMFLAYYLCRALFASGLLPTPQPHLDEVLASQASAVLYSEK